MSNALIDHLATFSEADWLAAVDELLPCIHEVDKNAAQIWFRFYPLSLQRFIEAGENREETLHGIAMQGDFELKNRISTSHDFLYGHRFWPTVKCKIEKLLSEPAALAAGKTANGRSTSLPPNNGGGSDAMPSLVDIIKEVSIRVAEKSKVDRNLTNAIAAIGLATLNQVGVEAFTAASGDVAKPEGLMKKSPDAIVAERKTDDSQGIFGFLRTIDKRYSVAYTAANFAGKFQLYCDEEIASASQKDRSKNWQELDSRCWEGPVPIECTAASCGTCWVGVLGGQEKLTPVDRRERRQMKVFGYNQPEEETPFIRLACQARAEGNVTIVIPPWNAVFGKKVYGNIEELDLEPVTTSAKALRETIKSAVSGE